MCHHVVYLLDEHSVLRVGPAIKESVGGGVASLSLLVRPGWTR